MYTYSSRLQPFLRSGQVIHISLGISFCSSFDLVCTVEFSAQYTHCDTITFKQRMVGRKEKKDLVNSRKIKSSIRSIRVQTIRSFKCFSNAKQGLFTTLLWPKASDQSCVFCVPLKSLRQLRQRQTSTTFMSSISRSKVQFMRLFRILSVSHYLVVKYYLPYLVRRMLSYMSENWLLFSSFL